MKSSKNGLLAEVVFLESVRKRSAGEMNWSIHPKKMARPRNMVQVCL
jgi:hypothetical protein